MQILKRVFSFEGIEGCGKSSAIELVSKELRDLGLTVYLFREPGSTSVGEKIRKLLLDQDEHKLPWTEFFLFMAARQELMSRSVLPLIKNDPKAVVILDRYHDSSLAYQGAGRGLGQDHLLKIIAETELNLWPEKRFYLSIPLDVSKARQSLRGTQKDYFEQEKETFFQKVIEGYASLGQQFPNQLVTIDATRPLEKVVSDLSMEIRKSL
jgi:dTMP kinase